MTATGLVVQRDGDLPTVLMGTCSAYLTRHHYITAAHCVPGGYDLAVVEMVGGRLRGVERIDRHPDRDLALLSLNVRDPTNGLDAMVYQRPENQVIDGGDFIGFGYPVEGRENTVPVGRLFKGHFQRYFGYEPPNGSGAYFAGEMSIPAPAGFSGGPLAYIARPEQRVAVNDQP